MTDFVDCLFGDSLICFLRKTVVTRVAAQRSYGIHHTGTMDITQIQTGLLLLLSGLMAAFSERIVGDQPFLSFTNEESSIGVELGFSVPLMKVPLEGTKRPGPGHPAGSILSAPIEVNMPALAVAATMFVASVAFVPKVFQLVWPFLKQPSTTDENWRRDNTSTILEHWKTLLDVDNLDKYPLSNDLPETLASSLTSQRPRSSSRKLSKRPPNLHRFPASCEVFCNRTSAAAPLSRKSTKTGFDP